MRWNDSNVAVRQDPAGNIKPDKEGSSERIDGISALVNAFLLNNQFIGGGFC
jgi:phage terminase large subunit-like protein